MAYSKVLLMVVMVKVAESVASDVFIMTGEELGEVPGIFQQKTKIVSPKKSIHVDFGTLHTLGKLSYWANKEEEMMEDLNEKLTMIDSEIDLISRLMEDFKKSSGRVILEASRQGSGMPVSRIIASNAILSHLMIHRFAGLYEDLRTLIMSSNYQESEDKVNRLFELDQYFNPNTKWPSSEDLHISHFAILHTQEALQTTPDKLYEGATFNTTFGGQLDSLQCAQLGIFAMEQEYYAMAIEWLEFSLEIMHFEKNGNSDFKPTVENLLELATQQHNFVLHANPNDYQVLSKSFMMPTIPYQVHREKAQNILQLKHGKKYMAHDSVDQNMYALCQDEEFQPEDIKAKLRCYRDHYAHPFYIINPLKAEQLSESPYIVQYYDVLSESKIQKLLKLRDNLKLSTVSSPDDDMQVTTPTSSLSSRTSAGATLFEEYLESWTLTSSITGLVGLEQTQMAEYVYGRLYWFHLDSFSAYLGLHEEEIQVSGDRVATVLYYLDEPVAGGKTPFCEVGIATSPVRGSAVFWLNMYRNGTARVDVTHGACPVLHGRKTVLNQWIRYNANFQRFRCSLNQFE